MTGFIGYSSGYAAMHACDVLLMLGTDFPYKQFFPTDCKIAQIDIRPENLGRGCKLDLGLVGDVTLTIEALLPLLNVKTERRHLDSATAHYKKAIHPQYLARVISEEAAEDAVFTADVGTPTIWAARDLKMNGRRRLIGSFVHGSMANAMPQAIGVQAAQPGRQVISLSGDGGITMLMGDLITLTQMKLPVKVIIFDNGVLGFVALEMKAAGFVDTNVDLKNPDFAAMARAIGIFGRRIEDPGELRGAIKEMLRHDGPALLDVVTAKHELSMPPTITPEEVKGFSLWVLRAVMNGRGDEVVDLAKTNLLPR
jgi:pyruvate dehydrogenase (quinone)